MTEDSTQEKAPKEPTTYIYEPAGITERSGHIPAWLTIIVIAVMLWGMSYAIRYWSPE